MDVCGAAGKIGGDGGEREIVRGDQAQGAAVDQRAHDRARADLAVVGIGSAEQLVDQKKNGGAALRQSPRFRAGA